MAQGHLGGRCDNDGGRFVRMAYVFIGALIMVAFGADSFKAIAFCTFCLRNFVLASIAKLQGGSFRCSASTCYWKKEGLLLHCSHLRYCLGTSRLGSQVATADPSSSSSRPLDVR